MHGLRIFSIITCSVCFFNQQYVTGQSPSQIEEVQGSYSNAKYLYSVTIPQGASAYKLRPPAPQHGIRVYTPGRQE